MTTTVIALISLILTLFWAAYAIGSESARKEQLKTYYKTNDKCTNALYSNSVKKVQESIDTLENAYNENRKILDSYDVSSFEKDLSDLKDHLHELEHEKWEKKADPHLTKFMDYYDIVMSGDLHNFRDVEKLLSYKKKCISEWQKYYAVPLDPYTTTIYPKEYFRRILGSDYDPCMESSIALDKKLSEKVADMRPEQKRKRKLNNILLSYVDGKESIMRAQLLKTNFDGYVTDEIKCCYRELVKKNRLVECKVGNRIFVSLSDSEKAKKTK